MAAPFSRSMRALHADSPAWSLFGLIVAMILVVAWALWFFLAPIAVQEIGQLSHLASNGAVVAAFPLEAANAIRSGQPAALRLQGMESGTAFPAMVTKVSTPGDAKQLEVELYPKSRSAYTQLTLALGQSGVGKLVGQAAIDIARVTPATMLLRTLGASSSASPSPRPSPRPAVR